MTDVELVVVQRGLSKHHVFLALLQLGLNPLGAFEPHEFNLPVSSSNFADSLCECIRPTIFQEMNRPFNCTFPIPSKMSEMWCVSVRSMCRNGKWKMRSRKVSIPNSARRILARSGQLLSRIRWAFVGMDSRLKCSTTLRPRSSRSRGRSQNQMKIYYQNQGSESVSQGMASIFSEMPTSAKIS